MPLTNPVFLFSFIWIITLLLYSSQLSYILTPLKSETLLLIWTIVFSFILPYLFYLFTFKRPVFSLNIKLQDVALDRKVARRVKVLAYVWGGASFFEFLVVGNFPLLSLFGIGRPVNYVDFGIGGLHGLLNACFLFFGGYAFLKYKKTGSKKYLYILFLIMLWPTLLVSRQLLLSLLIQLVFLYLITTRMQFSQYLKLFITMLLIIFIFGFIGDIRSDREHLLKLAQPVYEYPDFLPSGFVWVYIYITSPLNNINFNILGYSPSFLPVNTFSTLLPSFLRDVYYSMFSNTGGVTYLYNEAFNVSSFLEPLLKDFGNIGIIFPIILISTFSIFVFHKAKKNIVYVLMLSVVLHSITLSVFINFFTHIVFCFQMLLIFLVFKVKRFI